MVLLVLFLGLATLRARAAPSPPDSWDDFLARYHQGRNGPTLVKDFLDRHPGPLVESERAVLLCPADGAVRVEVGGDFTGWSAWLPMERLEGTNLFHRTLPDVPRDARLEYRFRIDGREVIDARNPARADNGMGGQNSVLAMPGYVPAAVSSRPLRGTLRTFHVPVPAEAPGQETCPPNPPERRLRRVVVYVPVGGDGPWPSLYVHDGSQYLERARLARVAEDLVEAGRMEPTLLVFVDPLERSREYDREAAFTREVVGSLVPFIDSRFPTLRQSAQRGVMGASMGGLVSLHLGLAHPEVFGRVASQSGAFGHRAELHDECRQGIPALDRIYLDVGLYDLCQPGGPGLLEANRRLAGILDGQAGTFVYREYAGGHSWTAWRDQLAGLLTFLFPPAAAAGP